MYLETPGEKSDCRQKLLNLKEVTIANSQNLHFVTHQRMEIHEERM